MTIARRASTYDLNFADQQEKFNWLYNHSLEHDDVVNAVNSVPSSLTVGKMGKQPIAAHGNWIIPKGWWYVVSGYMSYGVVIRSYDESNNDWVNLLPYQVGGMIISDGKNISIWNIGDADTLVVLQQLT
jgi:hypothetical protein